MSFSLIDVCDPPSPATTLAGLVLFLMTVAVLSIAVERWWLFRRSRGVDAVLEAGKHALAVGAGRGERRRAMERAAREHVHELGQGLRSLFTVGLLAPAVGLLATLAGMMNTFRGMALVGSDSFVLFAYGLSEALVPFAWALGVGLGAFWCHAALERRREKIGLAMARATLV